jgi:hypothetical protein
MVTARSRVWGIMLKVTIRSPKKTETFSVRHSLFLWDIIECHVGKAQELWCMGTAFIPNETLRLVQVNAFWRLEQDDIEFLSFTEDSIEFVVEPRRIAFALIPPL